MVAEAGVVEVVVVVATDMVDVEVAVAVVSHHPTQHLLATDDTKQNPPRKHLRATHDISIVKGKKKFIDMHL